MDFKVSELKITRYLLTSPKKSGFFLRFGYTIQDWTRLRDDVLMLARNFPLTFERDDPWGRKYAIRGEIQAPNGRTIRITTIWMIETRDPRRVKFLTAYPS